MMMLKANDGQKRKWRGCALMLIMALMVIIAGCKIADSQVPAAKVNSPESVVSHTVVPDESTNQEKLIEQFEAVVHSAGAASDIIDFINAHIAEADTMTADEMVRKLHAYYDSHLQAVQDDFFASGNHEQLYELDWPIQEDELHLIDNEGIRKQAETYYMGGYNLTLAEGIWQPTVDYSYQKKFSAYLSESMNDFIALKALESDRAFAKDGGLIISYDELADRALLAEQYLAKHKDLPEREAVLNIYITYLKIYLTGLVNTPLTDDGSLKLSNEVRASYLRTIAMAEHSVTGQLTKRFMEVLASENDFVYINSNGEKSETPAVMQFHEVMQAEAESLIKQP